MTQSQIDGVNGINGANGDDSAAVKDIPIAKDMKCEVKHLERTKDEHGKNCLAERKAKNNDAQQDDWSALYALLIIHQLDQANQKVVSRELQVNSEHLKSLMKDVIVNYPGAPIASRSPCFTSLPHGARCLFFYRKELQAEGLNRFKDNPEALAHLKVLQQFIEEEFEDAITSWDDLVPQGLISYEHLWTIFCPGTLVMGEYFGHPCAYELSNFQYIKTGQGCEFLTLQAKYMDFDGERFGLVDQNMAIPKFEGFVRITALGAYPLSFDDSKAEIRKALITKGRRFESFAGQHCQRYEGIAIERTPERVEKIRRYYIPGTLVMIDHKTFNRSVPNKAIHCSAMTRKKGNERSQDVNRYIPLRGAEPRNSKPGGTLDPLTEEELILTCPMVRGFSFGEKKWIEFALDQLQPVPWNPDCFKQLVLQESHKNLVRALVAQHAAGGGKVGFDDIVKGKGKGLIFVLHGPPGTGKTLTAEAVAESVRKPLYVVSAGDLGTEPETLEKNLKETLDLASTWRAVLLIDEADIFLERRALHDIQRNSLVSIFLRVLEYYEGILFLTSNRVSSFDDAMKSRIHMPLKYNDLSNESRKAVWKNFLTKDQDCEIQEEGFDALSQAKLNGRQIKNIVKTARSLALFNKEKLDVSKLQQVVDIQMEFEQQLNALDGA